MNKSMCLLFGPIEKSIFYSVSVQHTWEGPKMGNQEKHKLLTMLKHSLLKTTLDKHNWKGLKIDKNKMKKKKKKKKKTKRKGRG